MSTPAEVAQVRLNTNEADDALPWTDAVLGDLIDTTGSVNAASAEVWTVKAAQFAELVNTTEAGASYAFSDLHKNALAMAKAFGGSTTTGSGSSGVVRVQKIVRS
jgi:hypothetical protein